LQQVNESSHQTLLIEEVLLVNVFHLITLVLYQWRHNGQQGIHLTSAQTHTAAPAKPQTSTQLKAPSLYNAHYTLSEESHAALCQELNLQPISHLSMTMKHNDASVYTHCHVQGAAVKKVLQQNLHLLRFMTQHFMKKFFNYL